MCCLHPNWLAKKGGTKLAVFGGKQPSPEGQSELVGDLAVVN